MHCTFFIKNINHCIKKNPNFVCHMVCFTFFLLLLLSIRNNENSFILILKVHFAHCFPKCKHIKDNNLAFEKLLSNTENH